ncbi:MAG: response regulator [Candidatus Sericytochromatia bacterium]|uniref:Response regulator n=1 Tax=Candidatus Tanganyikabacteria bacterium TaxID=2961651 RepID=A0A937X4U2_9BACT|nr:response regulator [Candidatus Tanganyikabacteria bacterium]
MRNRILLVEDVEDNRELARELLEVAGYHVSEATNGVDALEQARAHPFDLVLLDLSLPIVDGWEALRQLKADPRFAAIPVVALTAHAMAGDRERALAAGFHGYIAKPIVVGTFAAVVAEYLQDAKSTG